MFFPILRAALESTDPTHFTLINSNKTEEDIIFREELEDLRRKYPDKFKYVKCLSQPDKSKTYSDVHIGHITPELLLKHMPLPNKDALVINMGPKGMNE